MQLYIGSSKHVSLLDKLPLELYYEHRIRLISKLFLHKNQVYKGQVGVVIGPVWYSLPREVIRDLTEILKVIYAQMKRDHGSVFYKPKNNRGRRKPEKKSSHIHI